MEKKDAYFSTVIILPGTPTAQVTLKPILDNPYWTFYEIMRLTKIKVFCNAV
jgi:hypothetical protein